MALKTGKRKPSQWRVVGGDGRDYLRLKIICRMRARVA
jgi:hypothetical protein